MGYVTANLAPGEQVIHRTHLHWKIFIFPLILIVFAFFFFGIPDGGIVMGTATLVIAGIIAFKRAIDMQTAEFAVTDRRIILKWGVVSRESFDLRLSQLETLDVRQGVLGRFFDYGRIVAIGTGGTRTYTPDIADPMGFRLHSQSQSGQFQSFNPQVPRTEPDSRDERECPHCAELISAKAKVCRYCGHDVERIQSANSEPQAPTPVVQSKSNADTKGDAQFTIRWSCPNCKTSNAPNFSHCYNCGQKRPTTQPRSSSSGGVAEDAFFAILELEGLAKARSMYKQFQQTSNRIVFQESRLDEFAIEETHKGNIDLAIDLLTLNVEAYPGSANCYTSLADAYKAKGSIEQAISYYRKGLEILVTDDSKTEEFRQSLLVKIKEELKELKERAEQRICPSCGRSNDKGSTYCIFCGTPLPSGDSEPREDLQ